MLPSEKEKSGGDITVDESALARCVSFRQGTVQAIKNESSLADNHLQVNYTTFNVIFTGWNICNSWAAVGGTLAIGITQGGSVTVLYGIILVFVCLGSCAANLAELASVYPISGGQYHDTSILSPKRLARGLSYCCGALNVFSWIAICGSACLQPAQCILLYQASNVLVMAYSMTLARRSNWIHNVGFVLSIGAFLSFTIVCLARSDHKQDGSFVWTTFLNETGWKSHGVVFLTGLINPNYIFAGLDGTIHLAEECTNPRATVPKALLSTICIGFISAFTFAVSMLYSLSDFTAVLETRTGVPIYEIWLQATRSPIGATVMMALYFILALFGLNGCQQTFSRLIWSFARDDALVTSKYLSRVPEMLQVPRHYRLHLSGLFNAFNAITGSGLVLQQLCFAVPAALLLYRCRSSEFLPTGRYVNLGMLGWAANVITVVWAILVTIFFEFPFELPVTPQNMNYTVVVIGGFGIFALVNWFAHAKKHYQSPRLELEEAEM